MYNSSFSIIAFILISFFCQYSSLWAQAPVNDDCSGLIDVGVAPFCDTLQYFSNTNATTSNIGVDNFPSCFNGGIPNRDVWFAFTASDTILDYTITVTGVSNPVTGEQGLVMPQIALYRGDCETDGLAELLCVSSELDETAVQLNVTGLTPGIVYFLRINDYAVSADPNAGSFQLCIDKINPVTDITQGGSTLCNGTLTDSGGEDGDYGPNENYTFTICPSELHECIVFTMDYFNIEQGIGFAGGGDQLSFYDGMNTSAPLLATLNAGGIGGDQAGGGVCYMIRATSGCLTLQMQTDATTQFEGFLGHWACTSDCPTLVPPVIDTAITQQQIATVLSSPQALVTVDTIKCPRRSMGLFTATDNSGLGLNKGILLTSGDALFVAGPNILNGGAPFPDNEALGDADLDSLSFYFDTLAQQESYNACIVELEVFAQTDELKFEYIFGSEEYPEFSDDFTNLPFNDIFAFLVSGPGIVGETYLNNQKNIAVLPNTDIPVEINRVNNFENWQYYRNNQTSQTIEYDGLTSDSMGIKKSLTARIAVQPCNTYKLKLAIADRGDRAYDSGVFVSEIKGGSPQLSVDFASGIDYFIEGCSGTNDELVIKLNAALVQDVSFQTFVSGSATLGQDYLLELPTTITFPAGTTALSFPIVPLQDAVVEGEESIVIGLQNDYGCGLVLLDTLSILLRENPVVEIQPLADTTLFCVGSNLSLRVEGATNYFWTPVSIVDNPQSSTPIFTPTEDTWVYVVGQVGTCTDKDSIFLKGVNPQLSIAQGDTVSLCQGDSLQLNAINNLENMGIMWSPNTNISAITVPNPWVYPNFFDTQYAVSINVGNCTVTDSIYIRVDSYERPTVINDTTLCQHSSVQLADIPLGFTQTQYRWTPATALDDATIASATATPDVTTTYQLISSSLTNACADTFNVTITVIPANVDILQGDTLFVCIGDTAFLTTQSTHNGANLTWSPDNGTLSSLTDPNVSVITPFTNTYTVVFSEDICTVSDKIVVRVDSIPTGLQIVADTAKPFYCVGELITLRSTTYDPVDYPNVVSQWVPAVGAVTETDLYNLVISAVSTQTYSRIVTNNACRDTTSILINVINPQLQLSLTDTLVCPNEPVNISIVGTPPDDYQWQPATGLSCTDCPNPTASPAATTTYSVQGMTQGCPVSASLLIDVLPPLPLDIAVTPSTSVLQGEAVTLSASPETYVSYAWTTNGTQIAATSVITQQIIENEVTYTLVVTNEDGCTGTATVTITGLPPTYDLPNAFSPDNDGVNDRFRLITTGNVTIQEFKIFNRWGQMVFDNTNTDGWDGNVKDTPAPSDVYAYFAKLLLPNGQTVLLKGDVTLLR